MNIKSRLKFLSFLQFFIWGCWLVTFGSYMMNTLHFSGSDVGVVYSSLGIASLIMPSLIGMLADKYISANYLYSCCHIVCAITLCLAAHVTSPVVMFWVMLLNSFAFMPTLSLFNTIAYCCLNRYQFDHVTYFPPIRAIGTVGFIIAMWTISLLKLELSNIQLYFAAAGSLIVACYTISLPKIETNYNSIDSSTASYGLVDTLSLFKDPKLAIFFLFSMLLGAVLQITNTFGNPFLHDFAQNPLYAKNIVVEYPAILLSLSQISEVAFILFIPFFLKRFGIKQVMLISMLAWVLRFGFFAFGDPSPFGFVLLVLSMIVYGCAFDFFNISGSIFIEQEVSKNVRGRAQGLFMTMVNGLGPYLGMIISGLIVDALTTDGIKNWQMIWLIFAGYSLILTITFYFIFPNKDKNMIT